MREKRLRKQEMEEQTKGSAEADPCQKQTTEGALKRNIIAKIRLTPPGLSPPSTTLAPDTALSTQKVPLRKLIPLKSNDPSPLNSNTTPGTRSAAVTSVPVKQSSVSLEAETESLSQSPGSSREVPDKTLRSSMTSLPAKQARATLSSSTAEAPTADKTLNSNQKKSSEHTTETKGTSWCVNFATCIHSQGNIPHTFSLKALPFQTSLYF